jgi:hypothetical protein
LVSDIQGNFLTSRREPYWLLVRYSIVKADSLKWKAFGPTSSSLSKHGRVIRLPGRATGVRQMRRASIISIGILSS